jgi:hypothetical protein
MVTTILTEKLIKKEFKKIKSEITTPKVYNFREFEYRFNALKLIKTYFEDLIGIINKSGKFRYEIEFLGTKKTLINPIVSKTYVIEYQFLVKDLGQYTNRDDVETEEYKIKQMFPALKDRYFFYLFGNTYIPPLFIDDRVITLRKNGIRILMPNCTLILNFEDNKFIFHHKGMSKGVVFKNLEFVLYMLIGNKIGFKRAIEVLAPLYTFYRLIRNKEIKEKVSKIIYKSPEQIHNIINGLKHSWNDIYEEIYKSVIKDLVTGFSGSPDIKKEYYKIIEAIYSKFKIIFNDAHVSNPTEILSQFLNLFTLGFRYNRELMKYELSNYKDGMSIEEIIAYVIERYYLTGKFVYEDFINDNNLKTRRIRFFERLAEPLFERIYITIKELSRVVRVSSPLNIGRFFEPAYPIRSYMNSNKQSGTPGGIFLYDFSSVYPAVKAMIGLNYTTKETLPMEKRLLDETHYNIICPIATSSQKPGIVVHLLPEVPLSKYGHFAEQFVSL